MSWVTRQARKARHGDRHSLVVMLAAVVLATAGTTAVTVATATEAPLPRQSPPDATPLAAVSPEPVTPQRGLPPSEPVTIDVPAIGVHSALQHVGLTADHTMEVPAGRQYNDAAWYKHSATPGSPGPAVIVGHVDSAARGPSVFFELGELRHGDEILVTRADGRVAVFRVDAVGQYPKDRFPTASVYGNTERPVLRLITCGGVFDGTAGHYLDNVVVYATLVGSGSHTERS